MAITPMMKQYQDAKALCGDALLLFRMGDFYELFYDDAKTAARVLGLTLTSREKGVNAIPMAGFPHHQLDSYLAKLITAGYRAAVCEQVEDPKKAKGLVKREVTRVVTPGTLTDDALLDPHESNFLAAVALPSSRASRAADEFGLAWAELSTGSFHAAVLPISRLADQLARIDPSECLVSEEARDQQLKMLERHVVTRRPPWAFSQDNALRILSAQFGTANLEGFGFLPGDGLAVRAAGAVLDYLHETQKSSLDHIERLLPYRSGSSLEMDEATRRSLEITRTIREGRREGSLLAILDRTVTAMGSRLLADWLANPLTAVESIGMRQGGVADLVRDERLRRELREQLRGVYDLQRLLARVATGRTTPRDLAFVGRSLALLPQLKTLLAAMPAGGRLAALETQLDLCGELRERLAAALVDDCPLTSREGGFIRPGHSEQLDQLRELAAGGKQWIARYQAEQGAATGIANLKVGYNKVFGYYIEITNTHREKIPDHYVRKQTLKNAERYITADLREYEEKVVTADEQGKELEYELFVELRDAAHAATRRLQTTASVLAELDVLASLAELACQRNYVQPRLVAEPVLEIRDGRHPVLDILEPEGTFVPNDTSTQTDGQILLITGPNMAGKSTYIRQVALITLMAQMGSFVPAREAVIGVADRIFARVGASDELSRGQSTFMVEMTEAARILNTATPRSLVVLDEIGRGTSTYDGVSLAWSIVEYLHDQIGCRTLFATHYHELTDLAATLTGVKNLNVAVREWQDNVVFLHKIVDGAADKSYGIHVARLAGVPREVNERAKQILAQLETEHLDEQGRPKIAVRSQRSRQGDIQLTLFAHHEHPLLDTIRNVNLDAITPLEALQLVKRWQDELEKEP